MGGLVDDELLDGRYRRIRRLGAGGMGEVWLAQDLRFEQHFVAIKRVLLDGRPGDEDLIRLMKREANIAVRLRHPHIVVVHDLFEIGGHPYLVMEYVEGESIADRRRRQPPLTPLDSARLIGQTASALAAIHKNRVVHRDVKPHNILIDHDGAAKLADFGIARAVETMVTRGAGPAGTIAYMAPEVARTGEASPASDVWSLGATFFDATEGHPPHMPPEVRHLGEIIQRLLHEEAPRPTLSGDFGPLISAMLATKPDRRPTMTTISEEIDRLRRRHAGHRHGAPPPKPPERVERVERVKPVAPRQPPRRPEREQRPPQWPPSGPGGPRRPADGAGPRDYTRDPIDPGPPRTPPSERGLLVAVMVAAVAVLVALLVVILRPNDGSENGDAATSRGPTDGVTAVSDETPQRFVRITETGFRPEQLTLELNDIVQFQIDIGVEVERVQVGDLAELVSANDDLIFVFTEIGEYDVTTYDATGAARRDMSIQVEADS